MIERTKIDELKEKVGQEVTLAGWVDVRRDHGKLIFIDLRDVSGKVQMVVLPNHEEAQKVAQEIRPEWVIKVKGLVNKRPEKMIKAEQLNGDLEMEVLDIEVLSQAKEMPFDPDTELNFDTYLDHLPLTLRGDRPKAIFKVQANVIRAFREFFTKEEFTEIQAPKLIGDDAEGGANSFDIEYFGHTAHLAQSPQFYKQIMVGIFEKVFTTGKPHGGLRSAALIRKAHVGLRSVAARGAFG